jgi:2-dehydro-3-deoxygalactonokinase
MTRPAQFLSCDWGTSSFRLRWVQRSDVSVIREVRNGEGVRVVHGRCVESGVVEQPKARSRVFRQVLVDAIRELGTGTGTARVPSGMPVVISGMASSSVGWRELPYAPTPCGWDGAGLRVESMDTVEVDEASHPVWMVSGLSTGADMMRGEETELMGVLALPEMSGARDGCTVVLPGTHAKHVRVDGGSMVDFRTYMTGELLEVLSTQTLLKVSATWPPPAWGTASATDLETFRNEFRQGVIAARDLGLARGLFQVRVRSVLHRSEPDRNAWYLAGLVLGAEGVDLVRWGAELPIVIAGAAHFSESYRTAIETLGAVDRLIVVPPDRLLHATLRSHALILERLERLEP